jgi:hypothetical protein
MVEEKQTPTVAASSDAQVIEEIQRTLHQILEVRDPASVEAAVSYAAFLNIEGLNAENYPLFFRMFEIPNHWVTDALVKEADPISFFERIPPNTYMVRRALRILNTRFPGELYPKTLGVMLGILKTAYRDPKAGYNLHPISKEDVINIGKYLKPKAPKKDVLNQTILSILSKISECKGLDRESPLWPVTRVAANIRNIFFDNRKTLDMAIPKSLMVRSNYRKREVRPSKLYIN